MRECDDNLRPNSCDFLANSLARYPAGRRRLARETAQTTRRLEKLHKERDFYILVSWKIGGELLVWSTFVT